MEENTPAIVINKIVQERKATLAVYRCEPYKAPRVDGVLPAMLQQGWEDLKSWIILLYKTRIKLGYIPECWRKAKGLSLPKPGKNSYAKAKSFRMITLTSYQLKVLERLVLWYLSCEEEVDAKLHHYQFGFRKGRSTEAALHQLIHRIEETFIKGDLSMGVFLDIEGAFDKVPFRVIEEAALSKGIHRKVVRWIGHMLSNRTITIELGDAKITEKIMAGCQQGGVLSPLLWNLVIDDLLISWDDKLGHMQAFANDVTVLHKAGNVDDLYKQVQDILFEVEIWATNHGLRFSHVKTDIVIFTNRRKVETDTQLTFYGNDMGIKDNAKYLSVVIDSKLTWKQHIDAISKKAKCILMQCKRTMEQPGAPAHGTPNGYARP